MDQVAGTGLALAGATGTGSVPAAPLNIAGLRAMLGPASMWADVRVLAETGSTNADVLSAAKDGAPEGLVLAAETQTAGRGRQGRGWTSLPGGALTFSVLLRPARLPRQAFGWLPLLAGVAVVTAVRDVTSVDAKLKWPNDALAGGGKLAGILAEQHGDAVVVGIGINVLGQPRVLPVQTATSLEACGAGAADRTVLLGEILRQFELWYLRLAGGPGTTGPGATGPGTTGPGTSPGDAHDIGLRAEYLRNCATIGQLVRVDLPSDRELTGTAVGVDLTGRLLVRPDGGDVTAVSAGDVVHVRPAS